MGTPNIPKPLAFPIDYKQFNGWGDDPDGGCHDDAHLMAIWLMQFFDVSGGDSFETTYLRCHDELPEESPWWSRGMNEGRSHQYLMWKPHRYQHFNHFWSIGMSIMSITKTSLKISARRPKSYCGWLRSQHAGFCGSVALAMDMSESRSFHKFKRHLCGTLGILATSTCISSINHNKS